MALRIRVGTRRRVARRQRGAVAVEFALVSPIVITLLIGTITTGVSYSHALGVTNAVREGARFGAIADATSGTWAADVMTRVTATQFDNPASKTSICVEYYKNNIKDLAKSDCEDFGGPGVTAGDLARYPVPSVPAGCVVRVVATRNFEISAPPLVPSFGTMKMVRGSVARYERKPC